MTAISKKIVGFAVHKPGTPPATMPTAAANDGHVIDPDRRINLKPVRGLVHALRWPHRPATPMGTPSWTSPWIKSPLGNFSITVGLYQNGISHPFEVWVNGAEAPRGLTTLAKLLSFDMRLKDPRWLEGKLEALKGTGGDPITIQRPGDGREIRVGSPVAAMATYLEHACREAGYFGSDTRSVMRDALICDGEPKTRRDGNLSWYVDVANVNTGDDFIVVVKEANVEGRKWPFSVWFSGSYPRSWDGLCKSLSLDMQVADPEWIGAKLMSITDHVEARGDFFVEDPLTGKDMLMPSTLAYVARLLLNRYRMLGILDEDGRPTAPVSMFQHADTPVETPAAEVPFGQPCPNCHAHAMVLMDGCMTCTACGTSKCS